MEEKKKKKRYEKPSVTRVKLDAKCAVLGFCKMNMVGMVGPGAINCGLPATPCSAPGS